MEKGLFHDLYKRLEELDVRSYPPGAVVGLVTRLLDGVLDGTGIPVVGE